jgi:hypothetical protein
VVETVRYNFYRHMTRSVKFTQRESEGMAKVGGVCTGARHITEIHTAMTSAAYVIQTLRTI